MKDTSKTKAQLIQEIEELRNQLSDLKSSIMVLSNSDTDKLSNQSKTLPKTQVAKTFSENNCASIYSFLMDIQCFGVYQISFTNDETHRISIPFVSPSAVEIMGLENLSDDLSWFKNTHPDDIDRVLKAHNLSLKTGVSFKEIFRNYNQLKKEWRWIRIFSSPVLSSDGTTVFNGLVVDITDMKSVEEELVHKTMMLDNILRTATDVAIATTDLDLVITYYNPIAEKFFGYTAKEVIGKTLNEIHLKENVAEERLQKAIEIVRSTGEYKYSIVQQTKDGPRYLNSMVSAILNRAEEIVGFCLFSRDVTESHIAKKTVQAAREKYENLVESTADWVWSIDLNGVHTYTNKAIKSLLGHDVSEILSNVSFPFIHPDDLELSKMLIEKGIELKTGWQNVEIRWLHKDGSVRIFESSAKPLLDSLGNVKGFTGIDRDITEHKKTLQSLYKSEFDLRTLFNAMTDIVFEMDYDGRYIHVAPTSPKLMFKPAEGVVGKTLHQVFPKAEADKFLDFIRACIDKNEILTIEYPMLIENRTVWFEGKATPKSKNTVLYIARDITEKKLSIDALKESEELLRTLINAMPDIVCFKDGQGRWLAANNSDIRLFQLEGVDFKGKTDSELAQFTPFYSDSFNTCEETDEITWQAGTTTRGKEIIPLPNGSSVVLDVIKVPLFYSDGRRKGLIVVGRDISAQDKAEKALQNERRLFVSGPTVVFRWKASIDWPVEYVSPNAEEIFGITAEKFISDSVLYSSIVHPEDLLRVKSEVERCTREHIDSFELEYRIIRSNGEDRWIYDQTVITRNESGIASYYEGYILDITNRKNKEVERELLKMAIEQVAETIVITDKEGNIEYVNPAFEVITGYSREEVIGKNPRILNSGIHDSSFYKDIWEKLILGENWSGRFVNRRKDETLYTEEATISPILNSSYEIVSYVAVKRDITAEIKLEEQLRQSQKMEAIGQLAGGVAHDFNNLLQVINSYTELALDEIGEKQPALDFLFEVRKAGNRAKSLVSQLLSFGRRQIITPIDLDLNLLLQNLLKMIRRVIGENIRLDFVPGHELGTIYADSGQIEQIIMNLCVNSRDALPKGGKIIIETSNVLIDVEYEETHPWVESGRYVLLSVTDDGIGMNENTLKSIFEPFFTTKPIDKGTGLGMSTVYGIVKQHKGDIQVYSELGKGTIVKIYLPVVQRKASKISSKVEGSVKGGNEIILLAEDDKMVRELTRQTLMKQGYSVFEAADGEEALAIFNRQADAIDFLLLDVVMPKLGGKEVYDRIIKSHGRIKVLFSSGYSKNAIHTDFVLKDTLQFIQKPYSSDVLLRKIREILDSPIIGNK